MLPTTTSTNCREASNSYVTRRDIMAAGCALALLDLSPHLVASAAAQPVSTGTQPKPATAATKAVNDALRNYLNVNDRDDFESATRGLIAKPDTLTIRDAKGGVRQSCAAPSILRSTARSPRGVSCFVSDV